MRPRSSRRCRSSPEPPRRPSWHPSFVLTTEPEDKACHARRRAGKGTPPLSLPPLRGSGPQRASPPRTRRTTFQLTAAARCAGRRRCRSGWERAASGTRACGTCQRSDSPQPPGRLPVAVEGVVSADAERDRLARLDVHEAPAVEAAQVGLAFEHVSRLDRHDALPSSASCLPRRRGVRHRRRPGGRECWSGPQVLARARQVPAWAPRCRPGQRALAWATCTGCDLDGMLVLRPPGSAQDRGKGRRIVCDLEQELPLPPPELLKIRMRAQQPLKITAQPSDRDRTQDRGAAERPGTAVEIAAQSSAQGPLKIGA